MIETLLRTIPIEESGNSYGSHIFLRLLCDRMNHLHTIPISLCLTIVYLSEVLIVGISAYLVQPRYRSSVSLHMAPTSLSEVLSHMLASQLDDIPPRGPRVFLSVIWMD